MQRRDLILSKFLAVFACLALACILALVLGFLVDYWFLQQFSAQLLKNSAESLAIALSIIAIECAAGALVGVLAPTVLVGVLLVVLGHNVASLTVILPMMSRLTDSVLTAILSGIVLSTLFLWIAIVVFRRQQL